MTFEAHLGALAGRGRGSHLEPGRCGGLPCPEDSGQPLGDRPEGVFASACLDPGSERYQRAADPATESGMRSATCRIASFRLLVQDVGPVHWWNRAGRILGCLTWPRWAADADGGGRTMRKPVVRVPRDDDLKGHAMLAGPGVARSRRSNQVLRRGRGAWAVPTARPERETPPGGHGGCRGCGPWAGSRSAHGAPRARAGAPKAQRGD